MMDTYVFRLIVGDAIDDDGANRLFEAGVDDGYPETGPKGHSIGFERKATSLREAILSAIKDVEQAHFKVLRVEPDELVSAADVAERTRRSRQSISALVGGSRGPGGWPRPVAGMSEALFGGGVTSRPGFKGSTAAKKSTKTRPLLWLR